MRRPGRPPNLRPTAGSAHQPGNGRAARLYLTSSADRPLPERYPDMTGTETRLSPGELVNISIRAVKVDRVAGSEVFYHTEAGGRPILHSIHHGPGWPNVTVERVAPAEWPPARGDVWRDSNGSLWFAVWLQLPVGRLEMFSADPIGHPVGRKPAELLERVGPLSLVHREARDGDDE